MTNEARAESNKFTCLNYALQGGIRRSQIRDFGKLRNCVTALWEDCTTLEKVEWFLT